MRKQRSRKSVVVRRKVGESVQVVTLSRLPGGRRRRYRVCRIVLKVYSSPYESRWIWQPSTIRRGTNRTRRPLPVMMRPHATLPVKRTQRTMTSRAGTQRHQDTYLRLLAQQLLTKPEASRFKQILRDYQSSKSLPRLCQDLRDVINSTEKLMILVDISHRLPKYLREDFNRLCGLYFENYNEVLSAFRPRGMERPSSKVIAQDSTGTLRVLSKGNQKSLIINPNSEDYLFRNPNTIKSGTYVIKHTRDTQEITTRIDDVDFPMLNSTTSSSSDPTIKWTKPYHNRPIRRFDENNNNQPNSCNTMMQNMHINDSNNDSKTPQATIHTSIQHSTPNVTPDLTQRTSPADTPTLSERTLSGSKQQLLQRSPPGMVRCVHLERMTGASLGLTIRHSECGEPIRVLNVAQHGQAQVNGLRVGDEILEVNGRNFRTIDHDEAVSLLRHSFTLQMKVLTPDDDISDDYIADSSSDPVFKMIEKDVKIRVGEEGFGFCLSGGAEVESHATVAEVFEDSVAEKAGLQKGDRVVSILGADTTGLANKQIVNLVMSAKILGADTTGLTHKQIVNLAMSAKVISLKVKRRIQIAGPPQPTVAREFARNGIEAVAYESRKDDAKPSTAHALSQRSYTMYQSRSDKESTKQFDPAVYSSGRHNPSNSNSEVSIHNQSNQTLTDSGTESADNTLKHNLHRNTTGSQIMSEQFHANASNSPNGDELLREKLEHCVIDSKGGNDVNINTTGDNMVDVTVEENGHIDQNVGMSNGHAVVYVDKPRNYDNIAISGNLNLPPDAKSQGERQERRYRKKRDSGSSYQLASDPFSKPRNSATYSESFHSKPEVRAAILRAMEKRENAIRKMEIINTISRDSDWRI